MINSCSKYVPLQPGLEKVTFDFFESHQELSSKKLPVILFYQFKIHDPDFEYVPVLPDACLEIIFELNPSKPSARLCGSVLKNKKIRFQSGIEHFGIRLSSEHGIKLLDEPIIEDEIPFFNFMKHDELLMEQMYELNSLDDRMSLFNRFVNFKDFETRSVPDYIQYAIQQSYLSKGNIEIGYLAEKTGYTVQYLRKKFKQYTGISPKLFNRIIRFQSSLNKIVNQNSNLLDVVDECGYYDQSHLINEFRKFEFSSPLQAKK